MDNRPWSDLLRALRREPRDQAAWQEALARLWPYIAVFCLHLARRRLNPVEDAEDVATDAVVELELEAPFAPEIDLSARSDIEQLVYKHTRKICKRVYERFRRKEKRQLKRHLPANVADTHEPPRGVDQPPPRANAESRLAKLSEADQQLLHLRYFDDLSEDAIAEQLHTTRDAVAKRLERARHKLGEFPPTGGPPTAQGQPE